MKPIYAILCVLGFALPCYFFIPFVLSHGLNLALFMNQLGQNQISAFFWSRCGRFFSGALGPHLSRDSQTDDQSMVACHPCQLDRGRIVGSAAFPFVARDGD